MWNELTVIWLYVLIEAAYQEVTTTSRLRRRGPEPKLSDAEVMTIEVLGEMCGMRTDKQIYWYVRTHWRHFFPAMPCHQTFARQCKSLSIVKQKILGEMFPPSDDLHVIDGFPIPICKLVRRKSGRRLLRRQEVILLRFARHPGRQFGRTHHLLCRLAR
jgi:hypothetical protein